MLAPEPGRLVFDGTLGGGGHAEALLSRGARVIGFDRDPAAIAAATARLAHFGDRVAIAQGNFRDARAALEELGVAQVDGALVDLGVSSPQLEMRERGFSFSRPGPLDMRMDTSQGPTLSERLATANVQQLTEVIRDFGEERFAGPIARHILAARDEGILADTAALADVVGRAVPRKAWPKAIHVATRTFQALRIWVNDELGALAAWLRDLPTFVAPHGRAAAISFHSLEDRLVKTRFRELSEGLCTCPPDFPICRCGRTVTWRLLTRKAIVAGEAELARNPRARSARLRIMERI